MKKTSRAKNYILRKAGNLFNKYSYFSVSMRDIAKICKLAKSSLYHHFKSKSELYDGIIKLQGEGFIRRFEIIQNQQISPEVKLKELIMSYFERFSQRRKLFLQFYSDLSKLNPSTKKLLLDHRKTIVTGFSSVIKEGIAKGIFQTDSPDLTALTIINSLDNFSLSKKNNKKNHSRYINHTTNLFLTGIQKN